MVNISSRYRELLLNLSLRSNRLDFCMYDIKSLSEQYRNKSAISGAQSVPMNYRLFV